MRLILLAVTLLFIGALIALTVYDVKSNGVTPLDVVSILIVAFFGITIISALLNRNPENVQAKLEEQRARRRFWEEDNRI